MMQSLIDFLHRRLQQPLPFRDIALEDIDERLKVFIIKAYNNPPKPPRICAVLVTLIAHEDKILIPFIKRPASSKVHAGEISFPGGGREEQDLDLNETALRETWEEIGVEVPKINIIGQLSDMYVVPSNSMITPIVAFMSKREVYNHDPKEADGVVEVTLSDLQNKASHTFQTIHTPQGSVQMPAFQIGEHLIWGTTARILRELIVILEEQ